MKAGDIVLFGKWSGTEVKIDGVEFLIMKESDIMGVLEGKPRRQEGRLISSVPNHQFPHSKEPIQWLPKTSDLLAMPASACCAASTFSPMR